MYMLLFRYSVFWAVTFKTFYLLFIINEALSETLSCYSKQSQLFDTYAVFFFKMRSLSASEIDTWVFPPAGTPVVGDIPGRACNLPARNEQQQQPHRTTKQKHVSYNNTGTVHSALAHLLQDSTLRSHVTSGSYFVFVFSSEACFMHRYYYCSTTKPAGCKKKKNSICA